MAYKIQFFNKAYHSQHLEGVICWLGASLQHYAFFHNYGIRTALSYLKHKRTRDAFFAFEHSIQVWHFAHMYDYTTSDDNGVSFSRIPKLFYKALHYLLLGRVDKAESYVLKLIHNCTTMIGSSILNECALEYFTTNFTTKFIDVNMIESSLLCAGIRSKSSWLRSTKIRSCV